MTRMFLAMDISDAVKKNLGDFTEGFRAKTKGVKWVEPANYHVTFKFFGNVDEEKTRPKIEKIIEENVKAVSPVSLACIGIGCFPKWELPRVIWAGLQGEAESLLDLQRKLEEDFEPLGFPRENREFKLHLTLARMKGPLGDRAWLKTLEGLAQQAFGEVLADHLTLYKSQLTKAGPIYTALKQFPFKH